MIAVAALLASQLLLEPKPPEAFHRLQPRKVIASSYLQNGWNQFEQNYLPPYVADDDPATAWVEGVKGAGEGEYLDWVGPTLKSGKSFRLFVRNGYQKSQKLYLANARPRKVRLETLWQDGGRISVGKAPAVEVELKDQLGWQQIDVPIASDVSGVRLTVVSVYPGTTYDDTCISDLRVYADAADKYKPEIEAAFGEEIRKFVAERAAAAKAGAKKAHVELAPSYPESGVVASASIEDEINGKTSFATLVTHAGAGLKGHEATISRAVKLLATYDKLRAGEPGKVPDGWQRVRLDPLVGARTAEVALQPVAESASKLPSLAPFFHRKDFAAFDDNGRRLE